METRNKLLDPDFWNFVTPRSIEQAIGEGNSTNGQDENGYTPLMLACDKNKSHQIIQFLIDCGADVYARSNDGETALIRAAGRCKNPEIIKVLIEEGADVNVHCRWGQTPLMRAVTHNKDPDFAAILINHDADITRKDYAGKTAWDHIQGNEALVNTSVYNMIKHTTLK